MILSFDTCQPVYQVFLVSIWLTHKLIYTRNGTGFVFLIIMEYIFSRQRYVRVSLKIPNMTRCELNLTC